ncbi:MAG: hypothetical protein JNL97_12135, partial [Verrucomicrobiales bacterium]|nr:hypothetical protein [Verrucomicrobiales bacterium]
MSFPSRRSFRAFLVSLVLGTSATALAELRLPAVFSDNAVLQQGRELPVWGWCDPGDTITVEFRGKSYMT